MIKTSFYIVLIGISLGWLIGLSISPIIGGVITSIISLLISIYVVFTGITDSSKSNNNLLRNIKNINLLPLALLMTSIALGSSSGVYLRTNDVLGLDPSTFIEKWKETNIQPEELAKLALKIKYGINDSDSTKINTANHTYGVLMNTSASMNCEILKAIPDDELEDSLYRLNNDNVDNFIEQCNTNITCLKSGLNSFICSEK